ncbi:hypothetical protein ABT124_16090 [Streptomyces sp. NPDC001982]|uniref:hypothetical protein n=1 Tax=Streptomyces sp. NPDC001982 TaxID=3154405 RepID=UPI0033310D8F
MLYRARRQRTPLVVPPGQRERLGIHADHGNIEVEPREVMALQPGLIRNVPIARR